MSIIRLKLLTMGLLLVVLASNAIAQTGTFTYQGSLTDVGAPDGNGTYLMEFRLFEQAAGGSPIDVLTDVPITVTDGLFMAELNFTASNAFDGSARYLETAVKESIADSYTTLTPRMSVTSAPYAIRSDTASNAERLENRTAAQFVQNTTVQQSAASFNIDGNGTLGGNLAASSVGVGAGGLTMNDNFVYLRGSGDSNHGMRYSAVLDGPEFRAFNGFRWVNGAGGAERMRLDGSGNLNIVGHYAIGGARFASRPGNLNTFVGENAGALNSGQQNTFIGSRAGQSNTLSARNTFVGDAAGAANTTANENTFVGALAGLSTATMGSTVPAQNTFVGAGAGQNNTTGAGNTFVGFVAGNNNTTSNFNTAIGYNATALNNVSHATAIGAGAVASASHTIVLGTPKARLLIPGLGTSRSTLCLQGNTEVGACSSSLRYKTSIAPFPAGLSLVERLQPITFEWKDGGMEDLGLGAEDVAEVEPLLVTYNESGQVEGVKYDRLGVVLLNAVKQQQAQIEEQQRVIDALKEIVCASNPNADVCISAAAM